MPSRQIRALGIALLLLTLGTSSSADTPAYGYPSPAALYGVRVEDEAGAPLPSYRFHGKTFVLGEYGTRYNVRVFNRSGRRIEAVVSIDGRDAVSGEIADFTEQRGYLIGPYDSILISGFRENLDSVRSFRFTAPANSYSARLGTPQNVGVIGLAVFSERQPPRRPLPLHIAPATPRPSAPEAAAPSASRSQDGNANSGAGAASDDRPAKDEAERAERSVRRNNLGTEYAEPRYSPVTEVPFVRARPAEPQAVLRLYYDDETGLEARGIQLRPQEPCVSEPQAFPLHRFAPPPPPSVD